MANKNLINLNQLRKDQLSGYILTVSQSYANPFVEGVSGELTAKILQASGELLARIEDTGSDVYGFTIPIGQNVDTIHCSFGQEFADAPTVTASLGSDGISDPIIFPFMRAKNPTGCAFVLSDKTPSDDYYLDIMISV